VVGISIGKRRGAGPTEAVCPRAGEDRYPQLPAGAGGAEAVSLGTVRSSDPLPAVFGSQEISPVGGNAGTGAIGKAWMVSRA
jgi:hypothetical protein